MHRPESQVEPAQLLNLIDEIIRSLREALLLIDPLPPVPPEVEAEFAPINHTEILKSLL